MLRFSSSKPNFKQKFPTPKQKVHNSETKRVFIVQTFYVKLAKKKNTRKIRINSTEKKKQTIDLLRTQKNQFFLLLILLFLWLLLIFKNFLHTNVYFLLQHCIQFKMKVFKNNLNRQTAIARADQINSVSEIATHRILLRFFFYFFCIVRSKIQDPKRNGNK